jgi:hypothetical protein
VCFFYHRASPLPIARDATQLRRASARESRRVTSSARKRLMDRSTPYHDRHVIDTKRMVAHKVPGCGRRPRGKKNTVIG